MHRRGRKTQPKPIACPSLRRSECELKSGSRTKPPPSCNMFGNRCERHHPGNRPNRLVRHLRQMRHGAIGRPCLTCRGAAQNPGRIRRLLLAGSGVCRRNQLIRNLWSSGRRMTSPEALPCCSLSSSKTPLIQRSTVSTVEPTWLAISRAVFPSSWSCSAFACRARNDLLRHAFEQKSRFVRANSGASQANGRTLRSLVVPPCGRTREPSGAKSPLERLGFPRPLEHAVSAHQIRRDPYLLPSSTSRTFCARVVGVNGFCKKCVPAFRTP